MQAAPPFLLARLNNCRYCRWGIPFEPVIHEYEGGSFAAFGFLNQGLGCFPDTGIWLLDCLVWGECADGFFIRSTWLQQEPGDGEICCDAAGDLDLISHLGHSGPRIENVGDAMASQHREVFGLQQRLVSHLNGIRIRLRQLGKELVKQHHEIPPMLKILWIEVREFENEHPCLFLDSIKRGQERLLEQVSV